MPERILFRKLQSPLLRGHGLEGSTWQVEFYEDELGSRGFPSGIVFVREFPASWGLDADALVRFVLVEDSVRRCGVATSLLKICKDRWPRLLTTAGISDAGVALVRKARGELDIPETGDRIETLGLTYRDF